MRDRAEVNKIMDQYLRNGWAPVPYRSQPKYVREAIRAAGFRPAVKQCFANSQRMIIKRALLKDFPNFTYVEGIVEAIIPIQHAWLLGKYRERIDLTLPALDYKILASYEVPEDLVLSSICKTGYFAPVFPHRLDLLQTLSFAGPVTGKESEAELQEMYSKHFKGLDNAFKKHAEDLECK